jgi:hypothetical protein
MNIDEMEWQYIGDDTWNFGPKVRGLVRKVADIYFDEDKNPSWQWLIYSVGEDPFITRGACNVFESAVDQVEECLRSKK